MVNNGLVPAIQCGFPVSASTEFDGNHAANHAAYNYGFRERGSSTWCAAFNDTNQWLQVNFLGLKMMKAIETKGRIEHDD